MRQSNSRDRNRLARQPLEGCLHRPRLAWRHRPGSKRRGVVGVCWSRACNCRNLPPACRSVPRKGRGWAKRREERPILGTWGKLERYCGRSRDTQPEVAAKANALNEFEDDERPTSAPSATRRHSYPHFVRNHSLVRSRCTQCLFRAAPEAQ